MPADNTSFIFLDDVRIPPSRDWMLCRDTDIAWCAIIDAVMDSRPIVLSLDHDLGEDIPTGYDLLNKLEREIATRDDFRPDIVFAIHSANPVGRVRMEQAIRAITARLL